MVVRSIPLGLPAVRMRTGVNDGCLRVGCGWFAVLLKPPKADAVFGLQWFSPEWSSLAQVRPHFETWRYKNIFICT